MHIQRLVPLLEARDLSVAILNHFQSASIPEVVGSLRRNPIRYYSMPRRYTPGAVHYHHSHWLNLLAVACGRRGHRSRYVVTLHGMRIHAPLESRIPLVRRLTVWALRRFDVIIAVNNATRSLVQRAVPDRTVEVIPAFIPPQRQPNDGGPDPDFFASHRLVVVAAYGVQPLPDGGDTYGLDTAFEAFTEVAREDDRLGLAIYLAEPPRKRRAQQYFAALERRLEEGGVASRVRVFVGRPLVGAFQHDVVFIRPTRREGDAVSVREALFAGVPVIASDVVTRPQGVETVAVGDVRALAASLRATLAMPTRGPVVPTGGPDHHDFLERLIAIYSDRAEATQS